MSQQPTMCSTQQDFVLSRTPVDLRGGTKNHQVQTVQIRQQDERLYIAKSDSGEDDTN